MQQASVGFHCPECAKSGRQKVYTSRSLMKGTIYATAALIAINVAVFVADIISGTTASVGGEEGRGVFGDIADKGVLFGPAVADGDWWRPITGGFLHLGIIHIGFNMLLLYQLGLLLEPALGRVRFLILYFTALIGGSFLVLVISPDTPTLGASGAVFGLMGASVVGLRSRGIDPFRTGIPQLLGINLVITFVFSAYISVGGHVGGLVAGFAAGWLLFEAVSRLPSGKYVAPALCAALGVALYIGCLYVASNPI